MAVRAWTADSLNEVVDMLHRARDYCLQRGEEVKSDDERYIYEIDMYSDRVILSLVGGRTDTPNIFFCHVVGASATPTLRKLHTGLLEERIVQPLTAMNDYRRGIPDPE